jgi:glycosyltransferase involved in cell wall biosynthesis
LNGELVSVVVPTYNRAYCICRAIDSVRAQTQRNWEVVLVDDGSTDGTAALIASKYGDDPRVRYFYQSNSGVTVARNTGIRESNGDYVAFLDSDDVWKPWKLETQLACFRFFPQVGMVWTNFAAIDAGGRLVNPRYLRTMYGAYRFFPSFDTLFKESRALSDVVKPGSDLELGARVYVGNIYIPMLRGNLAHTSTVMLSRGRLEKVKQFDEALTLSGEDYDFHFRTCKWGDVCFVDVPSTLYQLGFEDRLTKHSKALAQNFLITVQKAVARERESGIFPAAMIDEVLAEAHAWIARELFTIEDDAGVRKHALDSLRHKPWQPLLIALFIVALVPRVISRPLLWSYRTCKSLFLGRKRS